ncbi:MAG: NUDIX hydrolase [Polyangiales bacterium]
MSGGRDLTLEACAQQLRAQLLPMALDPEPGESGMRPAAVALLLRHRPQAGMQLLLVERARYRGDPWSGHVALPGGRREPGDAHLYAALQRECREEIGVDVQQVAQPLGRLLQARPQRCRAVPLIVHPWVLWLTQDAPLQLGAELAAHAWIEVAALGPAARPGAFSLPSGRLSPGAVVWGLTYRILQDFLQRLAKCDDIPHVSGPAQR